MLRITIVQDADEAREVYDIETDSIADELGHPVGKTAGGGFIPFAIGESTDVITCLECIREELNHLE